MSKKPKKWFQVTLETPDGYGKILLLVEACDVHGNFENQLWVDNKRVYMSQKLVEVRTIDDIVEYRKKNPWVIPCADTK